jgi:hypothetical protein
MANFQILAIFFFFELNLKQFEFVSFGIIYT